MGDLKIGRKNSRVVPAYSLQLLKLHAGTAAHGSNATSGPDLDECFEQQWQLALVDAVDSKRTHFSVEFTKEAT